MSCRYGKGRKPQRRSLFPKGKFNMKAVAGNVTKRERL